VGPLAAVKAVPGWVDARLEPARRTLPWRAWARYTAVHGNVIAGGIAYFAFFSLFPAMALGFTVFGLLLGGEGDLRVRLVQYVNDNLGSTVLGDRVGQPGIVNVEQLTAPGVLTAAGVLGVITLVLSGLGWIGALRDGVQAVFAVREQTNVVVLKLVDLLVLAAAGFAVIASVALTVVVGLAADQVLAAFGLGGGSLSGRAVTLAGELVLTVVDAVIFTLLFQRLAGVALRTRDAVTGGLVAAVGFTVLKLSGSLLLQVAARNRFLAAFGVLIGLLVWMNLVARMTLVAAAWSAVVAQDRGYLDTPDPAAEAEDPIEQAVEREHVHDDGPGPPDEPAVRARRAARLLLTTGFAAGAAATLALQRARRGRASRRGRRDEPVHGRDGSGA
jgi:membrane protein